MTDYATVSSNVGDDSMQFAQVQILVKIDLIETSVYVVTRITVSFVYYFLVPIQSLKVDSLSCLSC